ncbi:MAG: hypothetical protein RIA69_04005, partial [Cyclobacteriaceae bacterium]
MSCSSPETKNIKTSFENYDEYPVTQESLWPDYNANRTILKMWSPIAQNVRTNLYSSGNGSTKTSSQFLKRTNNGVWEIELRGDLAGTYYTFEVMIAGIWQAETPGIYAQAVGVNGDRAMVVDLEATNP